MGEDENQLQGVQSREGEFRVGDLALFLDRKNRKYLVTLGENQVFHSHLGRLSHDQVIDHSVGGWYRTDRGHTLLAVRPTLADFVLEMPRGPTIIYPKDLGLIVSLADIYPGARVVEAGLGSGSLTVALLRAVGSSGQVISYEINETVVPKAQRNIQQILPDASNLSVKIGDIYLGMAERNVDRVVLDVPEPWQAVPGIGDALIMGGIMLSFLPTILQVHQLVMALQEGHALSASGNHRDAVEALACCGAQRSSRPPHGGPQRISHYGGSVPAAENWDRVQSRAGGRRGPRD